MLSLVLRPLRKLVAVLLANDSPGQIATGVALGMVLGLTPTGNLLSVMLAIALCALRVNRAAGLMAASLFMAVGAAADPFTHRLGAKLLSIESLQPTFASLYDMPLGPWIGFNNTVVLGSFVMGVYLFYPCYLITRIVLDRIQQPVANWLKRHRISRWLLGAELTSKWQAPAVLGAGS